MSLAKHIKTEQNEKHSPIHVQIQQVESVVLRSETKDLAQDSSAVPAQALQVVPWHGPNVRLLGHNQKNITRPQVWQTPKCLEPSNLKKFTKGSSIGTSINVH